VEPSAGQTEDPRRSTPADRELSLGRGWRTAEREGKDVTERVFAEAKQTAGPEAVQGRV